MKSKFGLTLGLAATLMVGVFATMLALGLFTTNEVQAQEATGVTVVSVASDPATIEGFSAVTVTFTPTKELVAGDTVTIEFPSDMALPSVTGDDPYLPANVQVGNNVVTSIAVDDNEVTLTVSATESEGTEITAVFAIQGTAAQGDDPDTRVGIKNPAGLGSYSVTMSTSKDEASESGDSTTPITAPTGDDLTGRTAVFGLNVAHSPGDTNANARITVDFYSPSPLAANLDTITIEFEDDVQVPALLDERFISVVGIAADADGDPATGVGRTVVNPLDATVLRVGTPADEPRIMLTIGDHNPADGAVGGIAAGLVSVVFRQGAGIKNPTEQGTWNVKVATSQDPPVDGKYVTSFDNRSFKTIRTISLNAKSGKRGSTITVNGAGFKNSTTATVFLDEEVMDAEGMGTGKGNGKKEPAEVVLCDAPIDGTDTFTCDFTVNVPPFINGTNYINAIDGREGSARDGAPWALDPQIKATPKTAAIGDTVTVDLLDFAPDMDEAKTFDVGGIDILKNDGTTKFLPGSGLTGTSTHTVTIPNGVALGKQALRIQYEGGSSYRVTMTITGAQLSVTPSTVVPNQSVTITGHGFTGNSRLGKSAAKAGEAGLASGETTLSGIHIGGTQIDWEKIDDNDLIEVDSGGNWVATVVIPVKSPATIPGVYELKAFDSDGRPGVTQITVKSRTVEFEPMESRVGTTVTVSGSGWVASNSAAGAESANISVDYYLPGEEDSDASARANPDSDGNFTATIRVPLNASIPSTNRVEVQYEDEEDRFVTETAAHRVPGAAITLTPSSGPGGTLATLTGEGFKAFTTMTLLEVGGTQVQPRPAGPSVSRDGVLQDVQVLVPGLDAGTHTVKVVVGDATVSAPFTITADDAAPTTGAGDVPVADALQALIDNMVNGTPNLVDAYLFDGDAQRYLSFVSDPALASLNDLVMVKSGDVLWIRVQESQMFAGKTLSVPWTQVVLP